MKLTLISLFVAATTVSGQDYFENVDKRGGDARFATGVMGAGFNRISKKFLLRTHHGNSDVGDNVILVTSWWWQFYDVGDRIIILATLYHYIGILSVLSRSSTS